MPTTSKEQSKDTHGIVLTPRKQKGLTRNNPGMKKAMNALWSAVRASSASRRKAKSAKARTTIPKQSQRAAVRVTYVGPKTKGLWGAHGTYLQREGATGREQAGFDERGDGVQIAPRLDKWQTADDPRLYKIILSPEFGEKIDLERYTREVMTAIQKDVGAPLEWVAVAHYNTDHPHVHIALRSVTRNDKELHFPKDYIRTSIRAHAQAAATQQIGYRAQHDIDRARQKEIGQQRLTAIDRNIARLRPAGNVGAAFEVTINPRAAKSLRSDRQADVIAMGARLRHLEGMGLATNSGTGTWTVQANFTDVLKTAQLAGDRQRTFARQMAKASDTNLPFVSDNWNAVTSLSGRVLGHGEDEVKGKHFMLIEGVDGRIHHLPHRKETEDLRAQKQLRANEFVSFTKHQGRLHIEQFGDSAQLLTDAGFLAKQSTPEYGDQPRPGWLGAYDQAVMLHQLARETHFMADNKTSPVTDDLSVEKNASHSLIPPTVPLDPAAIPSDGNAVEARMKANIEQLFDRWNEEDARSDLAEIHANNLEDSKTEPLSAEFYDELFAAMQEQIASDIAEIDEQSASDLADNEKEQPEGSSQASSTAPFKDPAAHDDQAVTRHESAKEPETMKEPNAPTQAKNPFTTPAPPSPWFKQLLQPFTRRNPQDPQQSSLPASPEALAAPAGTLSGPRGLQPASAPQPNPQQPRTPDEIVKSLKAKISLPEIKSLTASTNKTTGDVTYSLAGKQALIDAGKNITVLKSDPVATRVALEIAVEKHGKTIDATGTPEFQAHLIDAAVAMKTDLTFTDASIQAKYQKALELQRVADLQKAQAQTPAPTGPTQNAPILLNKQQAMDYLTMSNKPQDVASLVRNIENDQKFKIDIEGGNLSFNDIEMGGEEGRALYANVTPEGREKIMEKLAIDDSAALKQAQLWVKEQTEKRVEVEKQLTAIQEVQTPAHQGMATAIDPYKQRQTEQTVREEKAVALAISKTGNQNVQVIYAENSGQDQSSPFKGEIIGATDDYILMNQDDVVVLHDKLDLNRIPETGKQVYIDYGNGKEKANVVTIGMKRTQKELEL